MDVVVIRIIDKGEYDVDRGENNVDKGGFGNNDNENNRGLGIVIMENIKKEDWYCV